MKPSLLQVHRPTGNGVRESPLSGLQDGRNLRLLNVMDDFNRQALGIGLHLSQPSEPVIQALKQINSWSRKPPVIHGPENISGTLHNRAREWCLQMGYIQPATPRQNACVERFNGTVRYEWLSQ